MRARATVSSTWRRRARRRRRRSRGEVVYADAAHVLCRRWNWRQDARTLITPATRRAVVTVQSNGAGDVAAGANDLIELITKFCGGQLPRRDFERGAPDGRLIGAVLAGAFRDAPRVNSGFPVRRAACARRHPRGAQEGRPPPACAGRDIFTAMKRTDPEGYAKIRAAADATPNTRALLWRIEGKDQPPSYLFGTIHSTDERVNKRSPAVVAAFNAAQHGRARISRERDRRKPSSVRWWPRKALHGRQRAEGYADPAELATLRKTLGAEGIPAKAVHLLRPWFAVLVLALPLCEKKRTEAGLALARSSGSSAMRSRRASAWSAWKRGARRSTRWTAMPDAVHISCSRRRSRPSTAQ